MASARLSRGLGETRPHPDQDLAISCTVSIQGSAYVIKVCTYIIYEDLCGADQRLGGQDFKYSLNSYIREVDTVASTG